MQQSRRDPSSRPWSVVPGVLAVLLLAPPGVLAQQRPPDAPEPDSGPAMPGPVGDLRQALRIPVRDSMNRDELAFRKASLEKCSKALIGIDALRAALQLQEWRDEDRDEAVAGIDRAVRETVFQRFVALLRGAMQKGTPVRKEAAATLLGEVATSIRGPGRQGVGLPLVPDLIPLLADDSGPVREAAARALGRVVPDAAAAAPALGKLLGHKEAASRRAAAEGLADIVRTLMQMTKGRQSLVELTFAELVSGAAAVVPAAGRGLADPDAPVRRDCATALRLSADILTQTVLDPPASLMFPPEGRKPARDEIAEMETYRMAVADERARALPLAEGLNAQAAALGRLLADEDLTVCETAARALESMAEARDKLRRKAASVPAAVREGDKPAVDPLRSGLQGVVPALAKLLAHKEIRGRLAAVYVLETLEVDAAPATDAAIKALEDPSPFVRWGAARVVVHLVPKAADKAVPGLAKLLDDENGDVRATAVTALERCGPAAKAAVPALAAAVAHKDTTLRVPAIKALAAVGPAAKEAAPALVKALADPEAEVRQAAARALGQLGPPTAATEPLRKALRDPDENVRRAASAALLGAP